VNGVELVQHSGGYLPFEADITGNVKFGHSNCITVAVNNTLTPWTIPQGNLFFLLLKNASILPIFIYCREDCLSQ